MNRLFFMASMVVLAACGGSSASSNETATTVSAVVMTTTTEVGLDPDCAEATIKADIGAPIEIYGECVNGWIIGEEAGYSKNCMDCDHVMLFKWVVDQWKVAGLCIESVALSSRACSEVKSRSDWPANVTPKVELPDTETACAIWYGNSTPEFTVTGGCFGPPDALRYNEIPKCALPLYPEYGNIEVSLCYEGEVTRALQQKLSEYGYKLDVDGRFGVDTLKALVEYQLDNNFEPTGIMNAKIAEAMGL